MPEVMQTFVQTDSGTGAEAEQMRLRSLRRLGQLAGEIQNALHKEDMAVVSQASGLLAPALAQWAEASLPQDEHNAEIAELMQEARQALAACETSLSCALSDVREQQGQVRQHQNRVKHARSRKTMLPRSVGVTLNLSR